MIINHNISARKTLNHIKKNFRKSSISMEKLSSGLSINRAGDDSAGLAISEKMRAQIRGLEQANRNIQDGISLIQTAESGLTEILSPLQRMRELTIQAANGILTYGDRSSIQKEIEQLKKSIDSIAEGTHFNNIKLLNNIPSPEEPMNISFSETLITYEVYDAREAVWSPDGSQIVFTNGGGVYRTNSDGKDQYKITPWNNIGNPQFSADGSKLFVRENGSYYEIDADIAPVMDTYDNKKALLDYNPYSPDGTRYYGKEASFSYNLYRSNIDGSNEEKLTNSSAPKHILSFSPDGNKILYKQSSDHKLFVMNRDGTNHIEIDRGNDKWTDAQFSPDGKTILYSGADNNIYSIGIDGSNRKQLTNTNEIETNASFSPDGSQIIYTSFNSDSGYRTLYIMNSDGSNKTEVPISQNEIHDAINIEAKWSPTGNMLLINTIDSSIKGKIYTGDILFSMNMPKLTIQIGANENQFLQLELPRVTTQSIGIGYISVEQNEVESTLAKIDKAINIVSSERSKFGAYQNRLEHALSNNHNYYENITASEARIRDVDIAKELMNETKYSILSQAAQAMLAQSNQVPQGVLQLLR